MSLSRALVRSAMNVSISCRLVSRPTLTLSAFTATFSGTPDASRTADGLGGEGEGWEGSLEYVCSTLVWFPDPSAMYNISAHARREGEGKEGSGE